MLEIGRVNFLVKRFSSRMICTCKWSKQIFSYLKNRHAVVLVGLQAKETQEKSFQTRNFLVRHLWGLG